jgi:hypothetical protein
MRRLLPLSVGLVFLCAGTGNAGPTKASTYETVTKAMLKALSDLSDVLETVKDKETAKAAAPKIDKIADRFEALAKEAKKLGKPSKEEEEKLKKYEDDAKKQAQRMAVALVPAVTKSGGDPDFKKALDHLNKAMQSLATK